MDYSSAAFWGIVIAAIAFGIGCYSTGYDKGKNMKKKFPWSD